MAKSLVLITGANTGLGYYAAQQLAATGRYHVIVGGRNTAKVEAAIKSLIQDTTHKVDAEDLEGLTIDVTSDASIKDAVTTIEEKHGYLDILMANAGIAQQQAVAQDGSGPSLRELYHSHYDTNVFGAAVTVDSFLPLLRKSKSPDGKRIALTSSRLGSFQASLTGKDAKNWPIYRSTKAAMNMLLLSYAYTLEDEGFVVSASNPGFCATNLNGHRGFKDPRDGAKALIRAAVGRKEDVHAMMVNETDAEPW